MPYNTNWKDGKSERSNQARDTPDPLKRVNLVKDGPWCEFCRLPHASDQCVVAQSILEEESHEMEGQPTINALSADPFWGGDDEDSTLR